MGWHEPPVTRTLPPASASLSAIIVSALPNCKWKPQGHVWVPSSQAAPDLLICTVCQKDAAVCTQRNPQTLRFKARESKGTTASSEKLYLNPPEITGRVQGNEALFLPLHSSVRTGMKQGSWTVGKIQGVFILLFFSPPSPQDRTLHSKQAIATLWKDIHTGDLIIAISKKLKLSGCGVRGKMSFLSGEKHHQVLLVEAEKTVCSGPCGQTHNGQQNVVLSQHRHRIERL